MRSILIACLIVVLAMRGAYAQASRKAPAVSPAPLRAHLTNDVIRQAVKEALADDKKDQRQRQDTVLGAERYENFSRDFSEAKVPDCLHGDGLKYQPTFFLGGVLALPFVLVAAARGKCH